MEYLDRFLIGDCRGLIPKLPAHSVDLVLYSPPYWGLRNYGVEGQIGLEETPEAYVQTMVEINRLCKRVLKRTGSLYINLGDTYAGGGGVAGKPEDWQDLHHDEIYPNPPPAKTIDYPKKCKLLMPSRIALALIDDGWVLRNDITWHKGNPMPTSARDRLACTTETIFHFVKNTKKTLLWHNRETGEWVSKKPEELYVLDAEENYVFDEYHLFNRKGEVVGTRRVKQRLWDGFQYFYDLDKIRIKHKTGYSHKFNLRVRDVKSGKKGITALSGELRASEEEVESYQDQLIKVGERIGVDVESGKGRPVAGLYTRSGRQQNHIKGANPGDVLPPRGWRPKYANLDPAVSSRAGFQLGRSQEQHPNGKNPGDVVPFNTKKEPYLRNNPHLMRQQERYIALDSSSPRDLSHPLGKNPGDYWMINTQPYEGAHFAVFPEALIEPIITVACPFGGVVLDPFMGSGTTAVVARRLGRHFIGIELNPEYVELSIQRLKGTIRNIEDAFS